MADDTTSGHPSAHRLRDVTNEPPTHQTAGPNSATWPTAADLPDDRISYGPDIGDEEQFRLLGDLEGKRVLDLGCGAGHAAVAMATRGAKVIAVDPDSAHLGQTREAADHHEVKVELHQSDLADLAFVRADSVDLVFSAYALATVPELDRVFRQVHRVLRPDLPLVFSLPHPAFGMIDTASNDPLRVRSGYWDTTPREFEGRDGSNHPHTVSEVFTWLHRANFRLDTLLEPQPDHDAPRSPYWSDAMKWIPSTLVLRARKQGI